jgi:hypothetical protein
MFISLVVFVLNIWCEFKAKWSNISLNFVPMITLVPEVSNRPSKSLKFYCWVKMIPDVARKCSCHVSYEHPWMS